MLILKPVYCHIFKFYLFIYGSFSLDPNRSGQTVKIGKSLFNKNKLCAVLNFGDDQFFNCSLSLQKHLFLTVVIFNF